jgi:phosphate-selective porin OprO/OprP
MRKSILIAGLILLTPAVSQAKTLEELLVEKGVITKSEGAAASEGAPGSLSWKNGNRMSYPSEGVTANVATQLQERYAFTDRDEDSGEKNTSSFETRRARIIVSGTALHEEFSYVVQTDFVGDTEADGTKSPELRDAYIKWAACDWLALKFGQMKTGISRQFNTSSAKLQFVERSAVSDFMDLDRQQGIQASSDLADGMIDVAVGMYNGESDGEGRNLPGNDTKETVVLNARVNALGKMDSYEEGDVNWTEDMAVTVGGAYAHSSQNADFGAGMESGDKDTVSVDANLKSNGLSVHAEYFYQNQDADSFQDSVDANGFYVQAGFFLDPKVLEIAARYALLDCDDGQAGGECAGNDSINQAAATINYYFKKHNLKAQFGYELTNEDPEGGGSGNDSNTNKWVFQVSAYM